MPSDIPSRGDIAAGFQWVQMQSVLDLAIFRKSEFIASLRLYTLEIKRHKFSDATEFGTYTIGAHFWRHSSQFEVHATYEVGVAFKLASRQLFACM